jgi:transposase
VLDGAGWHKANDLQVPESMTLLFLPLYSPERMPMERVWQWMRHHGLSNRVFGDEADIDKACWVRWNHLTPEGSIPSPRLHRSRVSMTGDWYHCPVANLFAMPGRNVR